MMMWGKWRVYPRKSFDRGAAKPPPRVQWRRRADRSRREPRRRRPSPTCGDDSRVRLILATKDHVAVEFNGPLLQFGTKDPARVHASMQRLGPDALAKRFADRRGAAPPAASAAARPSPTSSSTRPSSPASATSTSRRSSSCRVSTRSSAPPTSRPPRARPPRRDPAHAEIRLRPRRPHPPAREPARPRNRWDLKHWVFRRGGRPCWRCGTRILTDRKQSARVTFWCPACQAASLHPAQASHREARSASKRRPDRRTSCTERCGAQQ